MHDETESYRREMIATGQSARDAAVATDHWDSEALARDFTVLAFLAPFVVVQRKSDGAKGSMEFTHSPRFYFNWQPDNPENDR